jgi:haloalkane dehalogenase
MHESKFIDIDGNKVHYYESGEGDPVVYLHGIPTWSYLWRNIVSEVNEGKRSIAFDLLGYGKSGLPKNGDYSYDQQYTMFEAFIEKMDLKNLTLVVNDLGSAVGLDYAMKHPENVKGIVLIEAAYMTPEEWYAQLTFLQKTMFTMMRKRKRAEKFLVQKNMGGEKMVPMFTKRKLSDKEKEMYALPFKDEKRRYVLVDGPGPHTLPKKMISQEPGDFADVMNTYAEKLKETDIPMLLLYAKKGLINRKPAIEYAMENFNNLDIVYLGKGKHFLQEDHPVRISEAINKWYDMIN